MYKRQALHEAVRAGNSALAGQDLDAAAARLAEVEAMTAVLGLDDVPEGDDAAADESAEDAPATPAAADESEADAPAEETSADKA